MTLTNTATALGVHTEGATFRVELLPASTSTATITLVDGEHDEFPLGEPITVTHFRFLDGGRMTGWMPNGTRQFVTGPVREVSMP